MGKNTEVLVVVVWIEWFENSKLKIKKSTFGTDIIYWNVCKSCQQKVSAAKKHVLVISVILPKMDLFCQNDVIYT